MLSIAGLTILMAGCSPHSLNFNPLPLRSAAPSYSAQAEADAVLTTRWYDSFEDAKLNSLIEAALAENLDIRQALARVRQADAVARQAGALRLPVVNAQANAAKSWDGSDGNEGYSQMGAALSWELDAFNRLGSLAQSARLESRAAADDVETVRLSLTAAVAEAYYAAVASRRQLRLLEQQTDTDNKMLDLIVQRFDQGVGTNVDVLQQRSQAAVAWSLVPLAQRDLRVYENRLDVLMGQAPDAQDRTDDGDDFAVVADLPPLGVPTDLLLNRPDLRALKNQLIAADAEIAAAIADRLPRITLTGSFLYADGPGVTGPVTSVLGGLVQPLLDWGRRKAEVERNKALYEERLALFTQAYLEAVEDVENALYQENRQREFVYRLTQRRDIVRQNAAAAEEVYKQGLSDYLPALDALQELRALERELVGQQLNLVLYRIQLFRALGGPVSPNLLVMPQTQTSSTETPNAATPSAESL